MQRESRSRRRREGRPASNVRETDARDGDSSSAGNTDHANGHLQRLGYLLDKKVGDSARECFSMLAWLESFVANVPLTIGAIALAICNTGVVWFKFTEESLTTCEPVHFHSAQCTFPEFPGCFYCDTKNATYQWALRFHEICSWIGGSIAILFLVKLVLAKHVVLDELSSPTTAAPAGLICMTINVAAAGKGILGQILVSIASFVHLCLAAWFVYMALAYHTMPDPSWFPNTVSIGISAVKIWLYYPMCGHFLMAVSFLVGSACDFPKCKYSLMHLPCRYLYRWPFSFSLSVSSECY
jgi:hypothetical protein